MTSPEGVMRPSSIEPALAVRLVLGVARLGEADLNDWWSSQGMNPAVQFAMAGFRRTSKIVGAELALLSAIRRHRQVLPRSTAVHLFSPHLPYSRWTQAYLAEGKTGGESPLVDVLRECITADAVRVLLGGWLDEAAGDSDEVAESNVSAAALGDPSISTALLVRFAASYLTQDGELTVPYVDLVL